MSAASQRPRRRISLGRSVGEAASAGSTDADPCNGEFAAPQSSRAPIDPRPAQMVRQGEDLVMVAEIAGHVRIETTRRYSLPSKADRQAAMERMDVEF